MGCGGSKAATVDAKKKPDAASKTKTDAIKAAEEKDQKNTDSTPNNNNNNTSNSTSNPPPPSAPAVGGPDVLLDDDDIDLDALDPIAVAELEAMDAELGDLDQDTLNTSLNEAGGGGLSMKQEQDEGTLKERAKSMGLHFKGLLLEFAFPPIIFSGVSGSGKRTLANRLVKDFPDYFGVAVGHTTRPPREAEQDGKDYYFVSKEKFEDLKKIEKFVQTTDIFGQQYGVTREAIEAVGKSGKICVMNMEIEGVVHLKENQEISKYKPRYVLVVPPSTDELDRRLKARGDAEDTIEAKKEKLEKYQKIAEDASYWNLVVLNDNIDESYEKVKSFVETDKLGEKGADEFETNLDGDDEGEEVVE
eukprot:Nk52_evm1s2419 gene=Nk52_evmTU1s2419